MISSQADRAVRRRQIADYAADHDVAETMLHFGISETLVRISCREWNIVPRTGIKNNGGSRLLDILKQLLDGKSQAVIAEELHLSRQRVHAVAVAAKAAGIVLPEKSLQE